jgi:hypothetical protein
MSRLFGKGVHRDLADYFRFALVPNRTRVLVEQ